MSTTRNILNECKNKLNPFFRDFGFYLDSLDHIFHLQGQIGLDRKALSALSEHDQNRFKSCLFLVESANTTAIGALQLFASNLSADVYALLRMIYEVFCLLYYSNQSIQNGNEVCKVMFKSGLDELAHIKGEWKLIKKAQSCLEIQEPKLKELRKFINNFGVHISRAKIILGNVNVLGDTTISAFFLNNFNKKEYLAGLEILHSLLLNVIKEYDKHAVSYQGAAPSINDRIFEHEKYFIKEIRPKLLSRVQ